MTWGDTFLCLLLTALALPVVAAILALIVVGAVKMMESRP